MLTVELGEPSGVLAPAVPGSSEWQAAITAATQKHSAKRRKNLLEDSRRVTTTLPD
jgi:hypothetical protein